MAVAIALETGDRYLTKLMKRRQEKEREGVEEAAGKEGLSHGGRSTIWLIGNCGCRR